MMISIPVSQARSQLHPLIDAVSEQGPVQLVGPRHSAVLVSTEEWSAMLETLHIVGQADVMKKIRESESEGRSAMKSLHELL